MKLLPFLLLIFLVSCGPSNEKKTDNGKTPVRQKKRHPENIRFFETYSLKDISGEWMEACRYSAGMDSLDEMGFRGLRNLIRLGENRGSICYVAGRDQFTVDSILSVPEIAKLFPKDLVFMWSLKPYTGNNPAFYELFAVKMPKNKKARIDGRHIEESVPETDNNTGTITINLQMTPKGAIEWESMTRDNIERFIAITIADKVVSCPKVLMAISGGKTQISGDFSMQEAGEISDLINAR